ncbi:MAG TPA: transaldolase family protein [Gemmatimonadaceae bacterium]|jgi:transaldolase|nr:transaldolase family protein [Gemmatimonadaceae bacterium]
MKIFLATASTDDVAWGAAHGMLDGVVTSPGLLADDGDGEPRAHLAELSRLVHGPIFAAVHAIDAAGAYRDGRELAKLSDQIVVQLPLVEETLGAMRRLQADGVRVAATHVFNSAQALLAARAGASSVITSVERLDAAGHDGVAMIAELRSAFDASDAECDVIALHASSPAQFGACAIAGADAVAVTADLCRALLVHPLTDRGIDEFLGDVARLRRVWPST